MTKRTRLGRADLIDCLEKHDEQQLDVLAAALGYVRHESKKATKPSTVHTAVAIASASGTRLEPEKPATTPKAHFYRVVTHNKLKPEEIVSDMPDRFKRAKVYREQEITADPKARPPQPPELMRWSRLWPFLKTALGFEQTTLALDIPRIVDLLARAQPPRHLPRRLRKGWASSCQIIIDYAEPLLPFWDDFNRLLKRLRRLRSDQGLDLIAFPDGDPGGRCWLHSGEGWREVENLPAPAPGVPVLVLSDLGCIDESDIRRRQWRRLGLRLKRADCPVVALMPCPPRWWDRELARLFYPVCWDRATHPPRRIGARCALPLPAERGESDKSAEKLLALLAQAIRIEPPLLRAVRHLLPAGEADVGSEAAAWNHPGVHATPLAFYFDEKSVGDHRESFKKQDADLCQEVAGLIDRYHAHLSPVIGLEEKLQRAKLEGKPIPEDVLAAIRRITKTIYDREDLSPDAVSWGLRMIPRQPDGVWQEAGMATLWVMAHWEQIRVGEKVSFPEDLDLAQVSWLLRGDRSPQRYTLRQRGQALHLESSSQAKTTTGLEAPGSLLAEIYAAAPFVQIQGVDVPNPSIDKAIPLPENGRLWLRTDQEELIIESMQKPDWAAAISRDEYGLHVEFIVDGVMQRMRWPDWAESTGWDEYGLYAEFNIGGVIQRMRWIAPGEFLMGSPESEPERFDDETQHKVTLTQGYWLADTACTQALWQAAMGNNPSGFKGQDRPVESVSWEDVQQFIEKLNDAIPGNEFCLPTEAEWEYACRAGTTGPFWFGDQITPEQVNYDGNNPYADGNKGLYREETVAVKELPCNSWGLYQMHGNVWEWCRDGLRAYTQDATVDPMGSIEKGGSRVLRGGGWIYDGGGARSARRYAGDPGYRGRDIGFRLARGQKSAGGEDR